MSDEWYTPSKYIEAVREVMGSIDLDPASCDTANITIQATKIYTINDDGLTLQWNGNIWLNPPFSKTTPWIKKIISEYERGNIQQAICVTASDTGTWYFQSLAKYICCLAKDRIAFTNPHKEDIRTRLPRAFTYLGKNEKKFAYIFREFGVIVKEVL